MLPRHFKITAVSASLFVLYALATAPSFRLLFLSSEAAAVSLVDALRTLEERRHGLGIASWYSRKDKGIRKHTANGEIFDDTRKTCASWDYNFGTNLKVTNLRNGKSVICRVNDRGPAKRLSRIVDLSHAAFRKIADPRKGLIRVSVKPLGHSKHQD